MSQAWPDRIRIQKDPTNPKLFTNRASARIRLQAWDSCIDDCIKSIELEAANLKAYYLLAQAQLALHHPNEALNSAMTAYEECLKSPYNPSTSMVSSLVLQAKKEKWEAKERERIRRRSEMLRELEQALKRSADDDFQSLEQRMQNGEVSESEGAEERQEVESETNRKIEELWLLFEASDPANMTRRVSLPLYPNVEILLKLFTHVTKTKTADTRLHDRQHFFWNYAWPSND